MLHVAQNIGGFRIKREGTEVLLLDSTTGALVARMPWDKAEEVGRAIMMKAAEAEASMWHDADKFFTGGVKVKRVLGIPLITSVDQLNRI